MSNLKNVEAFNKLIGLCTGYGGTYVPGSPNLRVESLSELLAQAREALRAVSITKTGYETATNEREVAFAEIKQKASRILAELKSCGALPQTIADAAAMVRKMKGRVRAEKPEVTAALETETPKGKHPRATGSDYGSVVYHFEKLIATLVAEPKYNPAVADLQVTHLQQQLNDLRAVNQVVVNASSALSQARRDRNALLYGGSGSVYRTFIAVKHQVKALFGYTSEAAQAARRIRFTPTKLG